MNKRQAGLIVLLLAILAAAWLALKWIPRPLPVDANDPRQAAACEAPTLKPVTPKNVHTKDAPAPNNAPVVVPEDDADLDDGSFVWTRPPMQPDYGPALKRGCARADFEIKDARGQPVDAALLTATALWRRLGSFCFEDRAILDRNSKHVICDGLTCEGAEQGAGLEPGEYDLDVNYGPCGSARTTFSVGLGQTVNGVLTLPNWSRTICLHFVDQTGAPVPCIYQDDDLGVPRVWSTAGSGLSALSRHGPGDPLRDPPGTIHWGMGFGGSSSIDDGEMPLTAGKIPLTDGKLYLHVFAGGQNTITIPLLKEIWGGDTITLKEKCDGPEWDDYVIRLNLPPDFDARLNEVVNEHEKFPDVELGQRGSRLRRPKSPDPAEKPPAPDIRDVSKLAEGMSRVLLRSRGYEGVFPIITYSGSTDKFLPDRRSDEWWVIEVPSTCKVTVQWCDGKLLLTDPVTVKIDGLRLREIDLNIDATPLRCRFNLPSPTLSAFAYSLRVDEIEGGAGEGGPSVPADAWVKLEAGAPIADMHSTPPDAGVVGQRRKSYFGRNSGDVFDFDSALGRKFDARFQESEIWSLTALGAGSPESLILGGGRGKEPGFTWTITPRQQTLCLRAVSATHGGLPWVRGAVISHAQDKLTRGVHRRIVAAAKDGKKPEIAEPATGWTDQDKQSFEVTPQTSDDDLRKRMGNDNYDAFATRAQREFFCRNGTWYDTYATLASDCHGYMVAQGLNLEAGRYVLYLWSNSRDEMQPDLRLEFMVDSGQQIVDLGAVTVPDFG